MKIFNITLISKEGRISSYDFVSVLDAEEIAEKAAKSLNNGMTLNLEKTNGEQVSIFPVGFRELTVKQMD